MMNDAVVTNFEIRSAATEELSTCAEIYNNWNDETEWMPRIHSRESVKEYFLEVTRKGRRFWVATMAEKIVGYISIDHGHEVTALFVDSTNRGLGIGKVLLDNAKTVHPDWLELCVLEKNCLARNFYHREGFVEIPERRNDDTDEGIPDLLMRWDGGRAR